MDIQKNANCSISLIVCLSLVIAVPVTVHGASHGKAITPEEILIATYELPHTITPVEAQSAVSHLEQALAECRGSYLAFRIRYRMGVMYFRANMMKAKRTEQARVAAKLQQEYTRIMHELEKRSIAREDEELIDRLEKLKAFVNRIPVWPFDTSTLRRFFTAYIFPFVTALISVVISYLIKAFGAISGS